MKSKFYLMIVLVILLSVSGISVYKLTTSKLTEEETKVLNQDKDSKNTWLGKQNPNVVLIGSSVTLGKGATAYEKTWAGLLGGHFRKTNPDVSIVNFGVSGFTTADVLKSGTLTKVREANPDVIIFENCLLNDFHRLALNDTLKNTEAILTILKKENPETRIIVMPPNLPITHTTQNKLGMKFADYVNNVQELAEEQNVEYIDYYPEFNHYLTEHNLSLKDTLSDAIHPNDVGYNAWFQSIKGKFTK